MPALIGVKKNQTILIDIFTCAKKLFKTGAILWENAIGGLEISIEKPENCQLSDSFKEDVRGLIKLNAT